MKRPDWFGAFFWPVESRENTTDPCGSWLASDDVSTGNIYVV
ncbi:hypothetical protein [Pseudomonas sp. GM30]|nr:hypothetical protein [Pseudomonas sp. GM30]